MGVETDLFQRVYFNDGEGLTYGDLNDMQKFIQSHIWDGFYQKMAPGLVTATQPAASLDWTDFDLGGTNPADIDDTHAYALKGGAAFPIQGSTGRHVAITPGTLFQAIGAGDGLTPIFLPFTFTGAEEVQLALGDATNPRIDIVQMKLELVQADSQTRDFKDATTGVITSNSMNKKMRVQCTLSIKQGTPAATPAFPTVDSGYVPICGVYVFATWDGVTVGHPINNFDSNAYIMDLRMPMHVTNYAVGANLIVPGTNSARNVTGAYVQTSNASNNFKAVFPNWIQGGRVLGVTFSGNTLTTGQVYLGSLSVDDAYAYSTIGTYKNHLGYLSGYASKQFGFKDFQATQRGASYTKEIDANAAGFGPPIWTSGYRSISRYWTANENIDRPQGLMVGFRDVNNGALIQQVIFHVAE